MDLKISKVRNDTFIKTLHAVDSKDFKQYLKKEEENEIQAQDITDDKDQKEHQYAVRQQSEMPELQNLMEDSVISMAKLSEIETPAKELSLNEEE